MNRIPGIIAEIQSEGQLSLVSLETNSGPLTCIVIDTVATCDYLKVGNPVHAIFKETEVAIGVNNVANISLRNKIAGRIGSLDQGKLLARIVLETASGKIKSVITSKSAVQMALKPGMEVYAMIKTNEIMLAG